VHGAPITVLPELLDSQVGDRGDLIRADGSWPQTIEYLQSKRFAVHAAAKGPGSVKEGVKFLQGFTRILVDPSCENMRRELHGYSGRTERLTGKVINDANPIGVDDHLIDALRYAVEDLRPSVASANDDADDDGGVIRIPLWPNRRDPRDERWHLRGRRLN
jgi:phage terminase large subunit